jgi:hypothetical protein
MEERATSELPEAEPHEVPNLATKEGMRDPRVRSERKAAGVQGLSVHDRAARREAAGARKLRGS